MTRPETPEVKWEILSFTSAGRRIGASVFWQEIGPRPAILVLHGAGGLDAGNQYVRQLSTAVAATGYATFLIEYFDRTGTVYASDATIHENFAAWLETVSDAVGFVSQQSFVDPQRIGSLGYSLGGYLAVAHAAQDERIRAVVELAGGIDPEMSKSVRRLPPLLIVHGRDDQRVPFTEGEALEQFARGLGAPVETEFLAGERHLLSPFAAMRALSRALQFFGKHLE